MSRIKVSLHDATKLLAAGLVVEHYLILDDGKNGGDPESVVARSRRGARKKPIVTHEDTRYRLGVKQIRKPNSPTGRAIAAIRKAYGDNLQAVKTRKELTQVVCTALDVDAHKAIQLICNLRTVGYLKLVNDA